MRRISFNSSCQSSFEFPSPAAQDVTLADVKMRVDQLRTHINKLERECTGLEGARKNGALEGPRNIEKIQTLHSHCERAQIELGELFQKVPSMPASDAQKNILIEKMELKNEVLCSLMYRFNVLLAAPSLQPREEKEEHSEEMMLQEAVFIPLDQLLPPLKWQAIAIFTGL